MPLFADLALDPAQHRGHAAQPERAHQVLQPQLASELRWGGKHLVRGHPVQPSMQDAGKAAGRRCFTGRVEEQADGAVLAKLDSEEQRGLTFRYRLKQAVVFGVALGEAGQFLGELKQQLQPVLVTDGGEVVDDLLQPGIECGGCHGLSPRVIGTRTVFPHSVHDPS